MEDLTQLDDPGAILLVGKLLDQLVEARHEIERSQRRAAGIRKMIDGLVEMFPAVEDILPEDFDEDEIARPRGAEAVRRVLTERPNQWYGVPAIVGMLEKRGWAPNSTNPANAVRSALERLCDQDQVAKARSEKGEVVYGVLFDEEPF